MLQWRAKNHRVYTIRIRNSVFMSVLRGIRGDWKGIICNIELVLGLTYKLYVI